MNTLPRSIVAAGACIGLGLALQPLYAEPELHQLALDAARAATVIGFASGAVLAVGYVNHRLQLWASQRPIMPAPSALWSVQQSLGPRLAGEMAVAQAEERGTDQTDAEHQWRNAVVRFAVIGTTRGSMGWHSMKQHVDRPGWDCITGALQGVSIVEIGSGRRATWWADGWDCPRLRVSLQRHWIALPCPAEGVPVVKW